MTRVLDIDGADPLDSSLDSVRSGGWSSRAEWPEWRLALGLATSPWPAAALLLIGAALGPAGLAVLTPRVLAALDPAVAGALVVLGVLVGLDVRVGMRTNIPRMMVDSAATVVTFALVTAVVAVVARMVGGAWPALALWPLMLGVCATASATRVRRDVPREDARAGGVDDLLPVLAAGGLLAVAAGESTADVGRLLGLMLLLGATVALAGSLLVQDGPGDGEQHVYAMGALLLLTGVATYLSASALLVGAVAGAAWNRRAAAVRERLARDVRYLQHPVVVLLLVVAGALAPVGVATLASAAVFALLRLVGRVAGGLLAARLAPGRRAADGLSVLAFGVVGIGCALDLAGAGRGSPAGAALLGVVVWGAVYADLLSLLVTSRRRTDS